MTIASALGTFPSLMEHVAHIAVATPSRQDSSVLHLIFSTPCLYLLVRFVAPLPWPLALRIGLGTVMLIASQYHLWCRLSSGSVFAPEFPRSLILLFTWAFGTILLLVAFQLALDLAALVGMAVRHGAVAIAAPLRYEAGGLAMILAAIGVSQAVRAPPLRNLTVEIANLPPAFDGYRLIQLSNLHISRLFPERWARAVVAATNDLQADVAPLRDLRARDCIWFIPGNHEYFFGYAEWTYHLAGLGLRPLINTHTVLIRGRDAIVLAGVTDLSAPETGDAPPDLDAALVGAPEGAAVILLDHQPKMAPEAARRGVALQLSGHTHGGMIRGLDQIVALANGGYASGRYEVGGMILYVNNGTGLWPGFALRLGRPSELTQITLRCKLSRL